MNRVKSLCLERTVWVVLVVLLVAGSAWADAYDDLVKYDWSQGRAALAAIEADVRAATTPAARQAVEGKLLAALNTPQATVAGKQFLCRMLRRVGSARAVPALEKLLGDEKLSHMARFALQRLPGPEAGAALRKAVDTLTGDLRIGAIGSVGARRDNQAVPVLAKLAGADDAKTARAALAALGRIATPAAGKALADVNVPAELAAMRADARLLCADRMLADGQAAQAAAIYREMFARGNARFVRIAALRGIVLAEKDRAAGILLSLMKDKDPDLRRAAGKYVIEMPGKAATKAFAAALSSMGPAEQVLLIDALTARGDRAAAAEVTKLLASEDEAVRIAAIRALAVMGDAASVPVLAKASLASGAMGQAATDALNRLKGPGVGEAMAKLLGSADAGFRTAMLKVIAARADKTMIPAMLKAARDADENVRKAAVAGLATVAGGAELPKLVALLLDAKSASERSGLVRAVGSAATRVDDPDQRSAPVVAALSRADGPVKASLVSLLGRFGGGRALAAVREQLKAPDADVATEAVRALSAWPDAAPAKDLLGIIKTASNRVHKVLAFRGYLRMANLPSNRTAAETTAMFREAMALASGADEKRAVLSGLAGARSADAIEMAEQAGTDPTLRAEAELASVQIAANLKDADPDVARAALKKLAASAKSDAVRSRARGVLNDMDKYRGYITSWLGSGPYTQGNAWSTAFAPEKAGGKGAAWKPLSKGVGPQVINLLEAVGGGDNRAAYAKVYVWSPADQDVRLEMGSDDGIKVWLGGKLVHSNNATRPVRPGEDKAKARLAKGWNPLLVKIVQSGGDWGFCLRICRPDGAALDGIRVSLDGK